MKYGIFQVLEPDSKVAFGFLSPKENRSYNKTGGWFTFGVFSSNGGKPYFVAPLTLVEWSD